MGAPITLNSLICYIAVLTIAYSDQMSPAPMLPSGVGIQSGVIVLIAYQLLFAAFGHSRTPILTNEIAKFHS